MRTGLPPEVYGICRHAGKNLRPLRHDTALNRRRAWERPKLIRLLSDQRAKPGVAVPLERLTKMKKRPRGRMIENRKFA